MLPFDFPEYMLACEAKRQEWGVLWFNNFLHGPPSTNWQSPSYRNRFSALHRIGRFSPKSSPTLHPADNLLAATHALNYPWRTKSIAHFSYDYSQAFSIATNNRRPLELFPLAPPSPYSPWKGWSIAWSCRNEQKWWIFSLIPASSPDRCEAPIPMSCAKDPSPS